MGLMLVFGFIDMYLYIESSFVMFFEFDCCVMLCGVIMVICDLYEIVNVIGFFGIKYF